MEKLKVFGPHEADTLLQMEKICSDERVKHAVLCADGHLGYSVPVGGVVAYEGFINVNGVGYDIACGNKAVRLDCNVHAVKKDIYRTMNEIQSKISFGVGRKNNEKVEHPLFDEPIWDEIDVLGALKDKAMAQLGTVGSGNHYVDLFTDEHDHIWVGVHFGSRGLGHSIATHFVKAGGGKDGIHAEPVLFDEHSDLGEQYLKCMHVAGLYAYAGRDWVCQKVAEILRGTILEEVHNHHNFAWKERHFDKDLWVVRKGATPAFAGQKGFVGGSMGDISVILQGLESPKSSASLFSTVHGAGRAMGRVAAKGKFDKRGNCLREGAVKRSDHDSWMQRMGVEVRGGDLDESPLAYKRIEEVLNEHRGTIEILHTLKPIGVVMADSRTLDPYKD
jgi:tRNA-splicing ligase RtcB